MPRYHQIMRNGAIERVQFTAEEETAKDASESAEATKAATRDTREDRKVALRAKLADDSISDAELREFMRLQEGL
jgi:ribosome recycling factor